MLTARDATSETDARILSALARSRVIRRLIRCRRSSGRTCQISR